MPGRPAQTCPHSVKMKHEHVVPLSTLAQEVLNRAQKIRTGPDDSALAFPGFTRHALLALLARVGYFGRQTGTVSARRSALGLPDGFKVTPREPGRPKGTQRLPVIHTAYHEAAATQWLTYEPGGNVRFGDDSAR